MKKLGFRIGDVLASVFVLVLAATIFVCFLPGSNGDAASVEIYQNGKLIRTLSLTEDAEFALDGKYHNTITIRDGKVAITDSDCPGEDCVASGWISGDRRSIVCLPNGVEIRVVANGDDVDFVVG